MFEEEESLRKVNEKSGSVFITNNDLMYSSNYVLLFTQALYITEFN